jgi:hypothetical protein
VGYKSEAPLLELIFSVVCFEVANMRLRLINLEYLL